jgi:TRAP-type C4-dicarboxylate transport system permease small subunit
VSLAAAKPDSLFGWVTRIMNVLGTSMVLFIMLVVLTDVTGRFLFNKPLTGTPEIVAMSIAVIVYLQFPSTLRAGRVISADGLVEMLGTKSLRAEQWLLAFHHLVGCVMFATTCYFVWPLVVKAWVGNDFYGTPSMFAFPKWPVYGVIAFGSGMMAVQYMLLVFGFVGAGLRRERLFEIDPANKVLS